MVLHVAVIVVLAREASGMIEAAFHRTEELGFARLVSCLVSIKILWIAEALEAESAGKATVFIASVHAVDMFPGGNELATHSADVLE